MWKLIGYIFLGIIVLAGVAGFFGMRKFNKSWFKDRPLYTTFSVEEKPIEFDWNRDTIDNYIEEHSGMSFLANMEGLPLKLSFQFDTGAPYSMIYGESITSLQKLGYEFSIIEKDGFRFIEKLELKLGGNKTIVSMILIYENYGNVISEIDTSRIINVGTIGSDLLAERITAINFRNKEIQLFDTRPEWMLSRVDFKPFDFKGRRLMLPAEIRKKKLELFYDTGSSSFGLITNKYRFDRNTEKDSAELKLAGNSWGESIPIVHKNTVQTIEIGGGSRPLVRISYIDRYAKYQKFISPFTRIGGWLGNKPFINSTMIIDTKKDEFVVISGEVP